MNISKKILINVLTITTPYIAANPAGILPICKDKHGVIRVLLGRETSDNTWCDFGGEAKRGEQPWQTACREAAEETYAYFRPRKSSHNPLRASIAHINKKELKSYGCITQHGRTNGYHMYVVPFRYFQKETQTILSGKGYRNGEKSEFRWVNLSGLIRDVKNRNRYYTCRNGRRLPLRSEFYNLIKRNIRTLEQIKINADKKLPNAR